MRRVSRLGEIRLPRFFFHLENGHDAISDEEGVEADNPELAIKQALEAVAEMRADGELPVTNQTWTLAIRDEHNNELKRIPV